jgi:hypothetical protein
MTSDPTINNTGTEMTGSGYARQAITFGSESGGILANSAAVDYSNLPAGTITHWAIYDAASSGNLLYFGVLDMPIPVNAGDPLTIAIGNISIREE